MNELNNFITNLIGLLDDDFDGDFQITRRGLLAYIKKAKWNAEISARETTKADTEVSDSTTPSRPVWLVYYEDRIAVADTLTPGQVFDGATKIEAAWGQLPNKNGSG